MKKYYVVTLQGFIEDTLYLCTNVEQYSFGENPLFKYNNYIQIKRVVTRLEAEFIYNTVIANSSLHGGASLKTIEL